MVAKKKKKYNRLENYKREASRESIMGIAVKRRMRKIYYDRKAVSTCYRNKIVANLDPMPVLGYRIVYEHNILMDR
jgi:hypothetical protein